MPRRNKDAATLDKYALALSTKALAEQPHDSDTATAYALIAADLRHLVFHLSETEVPVDDPVAYPFGVSGAVAAAERRLKRLRAIALAELLS